MSPAAGRCRRKAGREKPRQAESDGDGGTRFVVQVALCGRKADRVRGNIGRNHIPEFTHAFNALIGRVAGNQCGIDCADRYPGDPAGRVTGGFEYLVDARLVGTQRATALQDQDAFFDWQRSHIDL